MKKGIAVAGCMNVDMLYPILGFPGPGELSTITGEMCLATGGCVCNDIIDLAVLDPDLPLTALGCVGEDAWGQYVLDRLSAWPNVDLSQVVRRGTNAYTLVMADEISKQRSFYYWRGASAVFCEDDINWDALDVDLLHVGYALLLDALDMPDDAYGTRLGRLLHAAQARGIKTSLDVVTEPGDRYRSLVAPILKYTDYCIINEIEAQGTTGVRMVDDKGRLMRENIRPALERIQGIMI